jgi:hypothetical protein
MEGVMNRPMLVAALLLIAAPVSAQNESTRKLRSSEGQHVFVIDGTSREWQGRLIRVTSDALEIEGEAGVRSFALAGVRRVDSDGDGMRDGILKGVIVGAVIGALSARHGYGAEMVVGSAAAYGLVGLCLDAANNSKHTVYRGKPAPQLALTMRW